MSRAASPQQTIRVGDPQELLAYIPHAMGYHPRESLVLLSVRPPRGRLGLVMRCDLLDVAAPSGGRQAAALAHHLRSDGAARAFCVIYTHGTPGRARRRTEVVRTVLTLRAESEMPPLAEIWLVTETGYAALECTDTSCCPERGRPLDDLETTAVGAALVLSGSAPVADRSGLLPPVIRDSGARRAFARGLRAGLAGPGAAEPSDQELGRDLALLTSGTALKPAALGALCATLLVPRHRDRLVLALADRGDGAVVGFGGTGARSEPQDLFRPGGLPPLHDAVDAALATLRTAAGLARRSVRGELCAVLAWLHWWSGEGAAARVAVEEALRIVPGQRLGLLVSEAIARGVAPGWVRPAAGVAPAGKARVGARPGASLGEEVEEASAG